MQTMARSRKKQIDVRQAVVISELVKKLPEKPHPETVRRYCLRGVTSPTGKKVFMQSIFTPRGRASTVDAYYEFLEELNES